MKNTLSNKQGQALLLVVMLLATVITVVLTVAFKSTTDTQITKLEEQSQKGLAAAEAGIEQALNSRQNSGSINFSLNNFTGTAVIDNTPQLPDFVSPQLQKDQQYTFYMAPYNPSNSDPFNVAGSYQGTINIYYGSQTADCRAISLEITVFFGPTTDANVRRYVADLGGHFGAGSAEGNLTVTSGTTLQGVTFSCGSHFTVPAQGRLMLIRPFYDGTRIGVQSDSQSHFLPVQGKLVTSTASESPGSNPVGGVSKTVQLFQSYPQIPAEYFVLQF